MKLIFFCLLSFSLFSQSYEPFEGKLVYSIEMADTSLHKYFPTRTMIIYTNDTIVRIENETQQLGKQVVIKHTLLNKSILLLQNGTEKYAIQTDLSKQKEKAKNDSLKPQITFKKKLGKRKILNLKANRIELTVKGKKQKIEILYLKNLSPKYIDAYSEVPGLPVRYYVSTEDGVAVYTLVYMEKVKLNRDLFGVPIDYKKVSFDQFMDDLIKSKNK
jgi:hypothetical protein